MIFIFRKCYGNSACCRPRPIQRPSQRVWNLITAAAWSAQHEDGDRVDSDRRRHYHRYHHADIELHSLQPDGASMIIECCSLCAGIERSELRQHAYGLAGAHRAAKAKFRDQRWSQFIITEHSESDVGVVCGCGVTYGETKSIRSVAG